MGVKKLHDDIDIAQTRVDGCLIGPYRTGDEIGAGGMANVFEAVDIKSGERVALKILKAHCSGVSEVVARFIREGRALQRLNHPNIVRVIDSGMSDSGDAWIAMERLHGTTLDRVIRSESKLNPERALRLVGDVAKALATVHARGMVHRDIKPENIFVVHVGTPDETAKLIDFGVAHVNEEDLGENSIAYTRVGSILGSAAFMAPEQLDGQETTAASDIFALAVTLYECLTGQLPFDGDTMAEQQKARVRGAVVPIRKRAPEVVASPALEAFIARCLSHEPARRPENGLVVLRELAALTGRRSMPSIPGADPLLPQESTRGTLVLTANDGGHALRAGSAGSALAGAAGAPHVLVAPETVAPFLPRSPDSGGARTAIIGGVTGVVLTLALLYAAQALHLIGH
jgi:serine/threonine-protein kinase